MKPILYIFLFMSILMTSCKKVETKSLEKKNPEKVTNPDYEIYNILIAKLQAPIYVDYPHPVVDGGCMFCTLDTTYYSKMGIKLEKGMYDDFIRKERTPRKLEENLITAPNFLGIDDTTDGQLKEGQHCTTLWLSAVAFNDNKDKAFVILQDNYDINTNERDEFIDYSSTRCYLFGKKNDKWIILVDKIISKTEEKRKLFECNNIYGRKPLVLIRDGISTGNVGFVQNK